MYKLLALFAMLVAAFAAPAPGAPLLINPGLSFPSPYLPGGPVFYNPSPVGYPGGIYPAAPLPLPISYTKYY